MIGIAKNLMTQRVLDLNLLWTAHDEFNFKSTESSLTSWVASSNENSLTDALASSSRCLRSLKMTVQKEGSATLNGAGLCCMIKNYNSIPMPCTLGLAFL